MIGKRIPLFRLFGLEVRIDTSWLFIFVLISWTLATGYFPYYCESHGYALSRVSYWALGIVGALGLFASILFHEMSHSLVARKYGLPIQGITLFIFGGVAEMGDEPSRPGVEFQMALAGPLFSIVLSLGLLSIYYFGESRDWSLHVLPVVYYLGWINGLLALFNLVPAFPLDGGRVLRSILWHAKKDLVGATRISSKIGSFFGALLIFGGILNFLTGNFIGGLWYFLIGLFLRDAAAMSYQQIVMRRSLEGETVEKFMNPNPITVPPSINLKHLIEDYFYRYHFKMFPVVEGKRLLGSISTRELKNFPKSEWETCMVRECMQPMTEQNTVTPNTDARKALALMMQRHNGRLIVARGQELVGMITLKDILKFVSFMLEFQVAEKEAA